MRVLVAYGSNRGGTEGLARAIGATLREAGCTVDVRSADEVSELEGWDAVVIGGALYAGRWQRRARRFVERNAEELRVLPVWCFSSGPLDDSARRIPIAPTPQVARLIARIGARGHVTFGGRLATSARGFVARAMVKQGRGGDFRAMDDVRRWARGLAAELETLPPGRLDLSRARRQRRLRRGLTGACLVSGAATLSSGLAAVQGPYAAWAFASLAFATAMTLLGAALWRTTHARPRALDAVSSAVH